MIEVYGASDDLIEVEGDIREEFGWYEDEPALLAFSDGTILSVHYGQTGMWQLRHVAKGRADVRIEQCPPDDESNYTDRAFIDGDDVSWVMLGKKFVPKPKNATEG